ncbi:hypothetical protein MMC10_004450 [Thelotrema lepadinum]|nr:hypothetical protein [Thelotrema lepadinum]
MATPSRANVDALLTEHLRYTPLIVRPQSLIDDIINTVNAIIYRALTAIETGLLNTPPNVLGYVADPPSTAQSTTEESATAPREAEEVARAEIEDGVHQLETLLEASVDKKFDIFELYVLRHILNIPDGLERWVVLGHYENIHLPSHSSQTTTPSSISHLRAELQAEQSLNLALEAEAAQTSTLLNDLKKFLPPSQSQQQLSAPTSQNQQNGPSLSFLSPPPSTKSSLPAKLTPTAQFTTSQLSGLRTLLSTLKTKMSALPPLSTSSTTSTSSSALPGNASEQIDWESTAPGAAKRQAARKERRKYMESTARRVVRDTVGAGAGGISGVEGDLGAERGVGEVGGVEEVLGPRGDDDEMEVDGEMEMEVDEE